MLYFLFEQNNSFQIVSFYLNQLEIVDKSDR